MTKKIKRILFYTSVQRNFRATLIGHLYELCQVYPVVLLSEKLDSETEKIIQNKNFFPKLEKIIPVNQYSKNRKNLLSENRCFRKLAKDVVKKYKPDIVVVDNDLCSFELYLMRFAKKAKAINICFQNGISMKTKDIVIQNTFMKAYVNRFAFLPLWLKLFFVKIKRYLGHWLYYWFLPIMVGETPFFGESSIILWKWIAGLRDSDYLIVPSKKEFNYRIEDKIPKEKLYILSHPLKRETRKFFEQAFLNKHKKKEGDKKNIVLMLPTEEIGIRKKDKSLITEKEMERVRTEIVSLVDKKLLGARGWQIIIKPHPTIKDIKEAKNKFEFLPNNIKITEPNEPIDKYIEKADVIIALPLCNTAALFNTFLQYPNMPILALDFNQEFLGDVYKGSEGVEYIDNKKEFINVLKKIGNNEYKKEDRKTKSEVGPDGFSDAVEAVEFLYQKKHGN